MKEKLNILHKGKVTSLAKRTHTHTQFSVFDFFHGAIDKAIFHIWLKMTT